MMNAAKQSNLSDLNVVPSARILVIDETVTDRPALKLVAETIYTPRHINEALKANGLKAAWVQWTCGREYWFAGKELAQKS
jgi:hypothetical protein